MMNVEIYDLNTSPIQYHPAARGLKFSKIWQGGEDLLCSFILDRSSAQDWPDVGYGYTVIIRYGLDALWRGYIRQIDQGEREITVTAAGTWALLDDFVYVGGVAPAGTMGRLWCDTRWGKFKPVTDDVHANFAPEKYQMDNQNRLYICPRKNENYGTTGDWEIGDWYYSCPYDTIKRVTFNYDFLDPNNWVLQLYSMNADRTATNLEWGLVATGAGAADITFATDRARIEFMMYYNAADAVYGGETGVGCYGKITELHIYGTADTTPTVTDLFNDVIDQVQAGTDIEHDHTEVETIALTLEPLFYERGEKCLEAMHDAASYGNANNKAVAWGVESGGTRLFLRTPDRDAVRYVVPAAHCRRLSARGQTDRGYASEGWGKYSDEEGVEHYTDKYYAHITPTGTVVNTTATGDDLASAVYGVQREEIPDFGRQAATLAVDFLQRYLMEHSHPQTQGTFEVTGLVQDLQRGGAWIMPYEVQPGYLVQIPRFRAAEAEGASGSDLREWDTTFLLAGLTWDDSQQVAQLIPEGPPEDVDRLMDFLRRFREGREKEELNKRGEPLGM